VPSGSYAVIYHLANDLDPAMQAAARHWNKTVPTPITLRSRADMISLATGLELIPPGVVPVSEWRPDLGPPADPGARADPRTPAATAPGPVERRSARLAAAQPVPAPVPVHGVVARKP
jgi:hypothetical protein